MRGCGGGRREQRHSCVKEERRETIPDWWFGGECVSTFYLSILCSVCTNRSKQTSPRPTEEDKGRQLCGALERADGFACV